MLALYQESQPVDPLTVTEHLRSRGELENAGGQAEVDGADRRGPRGRQRPALRRRSSASTRCCAGCSPDLRDPDRVLNRTRAAQRARRAGRARRSSRSPTTTARKDFRQVGEVLEVEIDKWQKLSREGISLTGTPSGFSDLDEITGGFQPGNLIILAARPSMGKIGAGHEHRRERRAAPGAPAAGGAVQPRDERGRARAALHRQPGDDQGRRPAQGPAEGRAQVEARPATPRRATTRRRCSSTTRRTSASSRSAPRRGGCTSRPRAASA